LVSVVSSEKSACLVADLLACVSCFVKAASSSCLLLSSTNEKNFQEFFRKREEASSSEDRGEPAGVIKK
jgi:hypothetical protein